MQSFLITLVILALATVLLAPYGGVLAEAAARPALQNTTYPGAATTVPTVVNPYPGPATATLAPGATTRATLPFVTLTPSPSPPTTDFASPIPGATRTPLPTLEPAPSIEIQFPTQPPDLPRLAADEREAQALVKGDPPTQSASERGSAGPLAFILAAVWLALGGLFVFVARKMER